MKENGDAPLVPEVGPCRKRNSHVGVECGQHEIKEESDALRDETPFVPLVARKKSGGVVKRGRHQRSMPNTD